MNSKDCYATLKEVLGPVLRPLGFKKTSGGMLGYAKHHKYGFTTLWFQVDKWGWDKRWGSRFTVEFQQGELAQPGAGNIHSRQRIGYLLEGHDPYLEDIRRINNAVIHRLPGFLNAEGQFATVDGMNFQTIGYSPRKDPYEEDVWLNYFTTEDVKAWGTYFGERMPRLIEIFETPILSPMQQARQRFDAAFEEARAKLAGSRAAAIAHLHAYIQNEPEQRLRVAAQNIVKFWVDDSRPPLP